VSNAFGIAFLKTGLLDRLALPKRRNALLHAVGMEADAYEAGPFNPDTDLSEDAQLSILAGFNGLEVWCGFPVAYMVEQMHTASPALPKVEGLFVAQHDGITHHAHQYVSSGRYGSGKLTPTSRGTSWARTFRIEDAPIPQSAALRAALQDLAEDLGAPFDLVERGYSGMRGKGAYGLAWHERKGKWVMAKSLEPAPDTKLPELQELNPNSYAKTGKPFAATLSRSDGSSFLTQDDLIYEVQHRAIANYLGARIDTQAGLDLLSGQPCTRLSVRVRRM
jgi:hypothetical protein